MNKFEKIINFFGGFFQLHDDRKDIVTGKADREKRFVWRIIASESTGTRRLRPDVEEKDTQSDTQNL